MMTAPIPFELASTDNVTGLFTSKNCKTGVWVITVFNFMKASLCTFVQCQSTSFSRSCLNGAANCDILGTNFWRYVITPRNRRKSSADSGEGISVIAWIFSGSAFSPLSVNKCPMYGTSVARNLHLSLFSSGFFPWLFAILFLGTHHAALGPHPTLECHQ